MTSAATLLHELKDAGIRLEALGVDRLRVVAPPGKLTEELKQTLSAAKPQLIAALRDADPVHKYARPIVHFRLPGNDNFATCIGRPGESRDEVIADLRERWPGVEVRL